MIAYSTLLLFHKIKMQLSFIKKWLYLEFGKYRIIRLNK